MRRLLLFIAASLIAVAAAATPAHAGLGSWTSLSGLTSASNADWVREYVRASPPNVTHLYAATEDDGVFRSTNAGVSWSAFNSGLTAIPGAKNVRTVYADGANRMLAGTSAGLFVSTNGGAWQPLAQGAEDDPQNPKRLNVAVQALYRVTGGSLLAGGFSSGVFRSNDNGATWIHPAPGNGMPAATTVWQLTSLVPGVVLAATSSGIYRSINGGASWTLASDGLVGTTLRVFADGTNPNIFYAATAGGGVFRSINLGVTWSSVNGSGAKSLGNTTVRGLIHVAGVDQTRLYAATADGLWAGSTGNGPVPGAVTWRKVTNTGLGANTIFWTISDLIPGSFIAGTQSNGGYAMTLTPPVNVTDPTASGTLKVGKTLSTTTGTWSGTETIEFEYQWQRCTTNQANTCTDIDGAESSTYTLTLADFGKYLRSVVTAQNDVPTFGLIQEESALVGTVGAADGSLPGDNQQSAASISGPGLPQSGNTLTAQSWLFNPAATTTSFRWYRCTTTNESSCTLVPGVSGTQYLLSDADVDRRIRVRVVGTNQFGTTTLGFSGATNIIFPQAATALVAPSLEGTAQVGQSLAAHVGAWKFPGTTYERQWYRCEADGGSCQTLSGQKGSIYTLTADDLGKRVRAEIKADSNGPNTFPAPVFVNTPLSAVVAAAPAQNAGAGGPAPQEAPAQQQQQNAAAPPPPAADTIAPALTAVSLASSKVKAGGALTIAYRPNEASALRVQVQRLTKGRRVGKACKTGRKKGKRCTIAKTVLTKTFPPATGSAKVTLSLRAGGKKLPAGRYRLVVTPVDGAGNRGPARTVTFRITR